MAPQLLPRTPRAVIFDMDGLLFDTEALYQRAIAAAASEGEHELGATAEMMIGRPHAQCRTLLLERHGPSFPADAFIEAIVVRFEQLAATDLALKPGVPELLGALDQLGLPRAIATSSAHHTVQHHLAAHGLVGRFHHIVGHGDYLLSKPAPDPFLRAAALLGVEPAHCLALEDSYGGVRSASSAGMMTVMVPDLLPATDEIAELCTLVARDLHQVRDLLLAP